MGSLTCSQTRVGAAASPGGASPTGKGAQRLRAVSENQGLHGPQPQSPKQNFVFFYLVKIYITQFVIFTILSIQLMALMTFMMCNLPSPPHCLSQTFHCSKQKGPPAWNGADPPALKPLAASHSLAVSPNSGHTLLTPRVSPSRICSSRRGGTGS